MKSHFSSPPAAGDRYEHELTTLLGIALSRRKLAQDLAAEYADRCAEATSAMPGDCVAMLRNEGRADAWGGAIALLTEALAAKRREP